MTFPKCLIFHPATQSHIVRDDRLRGQREVRQGTNTNRPRAVYTGQRLFMCSVCMFLTDCTEPYHGTISCDLPWS